LPHRSLSLFFFVSRRLPWNNRGPTFSLGNCCVRSGDRVFPFTVFHTVMKSPVSLPGSIVPAPFFSLLDCIPSPIVPGTPVSRNLFGPVRESFSYEVTVCPGTLPISLRLFSHASPGTSSSFFVFGLQRQSLTLSGLFLSTVTFRLRARTIRALSPPLFLIQLSHFVTHFLHRRLILLPFPRPPSVHCSPLRFVNLSGSVAHDLRSRPPSHQARTHLRSGIPLVRSSFPEHGPFRLLFLFPPFSLFRALHASFGFITHGIAFTLRLPVFVVTLTVHFPRSTPDFFPAGILPSGRLVCFRQRPCSPLFLLPPRRSLFA